MNPKPIAVRLDDQALDAVNVWRKTHDDPPTKSEALRLLVEAQLSSLGLWSPEGDMAPKKPAKPRK
ncbi:MAG: hypothetical protein J2P50_09665 [Hyphomicrobiaceae bacterium]|nr:hypothetical protein [Hyphomicrobiaceae bacterium]